MFTARFALAFLLTLGCSMAFSQQVIAHRGASHDAPENTVAAFRLAWEQGADGVEGDFYLTKDGHIVCIHDGATGRTGDKNFKVSTATLEELKSVDVGAKKGAPFRGERIPTLAEVLAVVPAGKRIFIEIKCGPEILPALEENLAQSKLAQEQIAILSFSEQVVEQARRKLPRIRAYWLVEFKRAAGSQNRLTPELGHVEQTLKRLDASGLDFGASSRPLDPDDAARLRSAGFELHCWTVDDEPLARYCRQLGAQSITTNRPAEMRKWLSADAR
jgi:glycerophosphoryl diester phosphodiesterase